MTRAAVLVAMLVLAATGCGGGSRNGSPGAQRKLTNLRSIGELRTAFNAASGEPRLIVLVSPT